ncbi:MAG: RNA polymerase sigma factor RpoD/SigA [Candidatus Cloacimonetes bacterium]|nr:RNA polymerase sigma factor RpoD/SigA [Candidatus Cloacimonadota bacterium]
MLENPAKDKGLQKYLSNIANIPTLSREEEKILLKKAKKGNKKAMDKLTESNLKFVVKVASKFQGKGLSLSELISEGNIGLIKAINRFDIRRNTKLITYAVWWIQQSIQYAIYERNRLIRIPAKTISTLSKIEDARQRYRASKGEEPQLKTIAKEVEIKEKRAKDILSRKADVIALDAMYGDNDALSRLKTKKIAGLNLSDVQEDPQKIYYRKKLKDKINRRIGELSPRDAHIIKEYFGLSVRKNGDDKGKNFAQIARELGLSRERIRQIVKEIIEKLRKEVVNEVDIDYLLRI